MPNTMSFLPFSGQLYPLTSTLLTSGNSSITMSEGKHCLLLSCNDQYLVCFLLHNSILAFTILSSTILLLHIPKRIWSFVKPIIMSHLVFQLQCTQQFFTSLTSWLDWNCVLPTPSSITDHLSALILNCVISIICFAHVLSPTHTESLVPRTRPRHNRCSL